MSVVSAKITMSSMIGLGLGVQCESVSVVNARVTMSAMRGTD